MENNPYCSLFKIMRFSLSNSKN